MLEKVNHTEKHYSFYIDDDSQVGHARRTAGYWAKGHGFSESFISNLQIIITELGTNLIKFAQNTGELLLRFDLSEKEQMGCHIISVDTGPGIFNITQALSDGVSTAGSRGVGLGAVKRLSHSFDIFSQPKVCTVMVACLYERNRAPKVIQQHADIGYVCVPLSYEELCGDLVWFENGKDYIRVAVVDGSGHGEPGATASAAAAEVIKTTTIRNNPQMALQTTSDGIYHTRGAAISMCNIFLEHNKLAHCGVGNVNGRIYTSETTRGLVCLGGIVGVGKVRSKDQIEDFNPNDILIYNSDGLKTFTDLNKHPRLLSQTAIVIAAFLYKLFKRGNDDACVFVLKRNHT